MDTPVCTKHDHPMIRRRDPKTGRPKEPTEWVCGRCAIDALFPDTNGHGKKEAWGRTQPKPKTIVSEND